MTMDPVRLRGVYALIDPAAHAEPLIIHVHDARTGVVDVYTGTRHVRLTDPQLAARLARAAR